MGARNEKKSTGNGRKEDEPLRLRRAGRGLQAESARAALGITGEGRAET